MLADFTSPLSADGALTWNGEKVELKIETSNLRALIEGNQSEVSVSLSSEPVRLRFQGELTLADTVTTSGDIELDVASVRRLADWAGQPVEMPGDGLGPLSIKGKLAFAGSTASFSEAEIRLDAIVGTGEIAVTTGGARPAIKGRLDVETLDLNPYLPPQPPPAETAAWDQQPSDLEGLKATDADLALSAQAIKYRRIEIGRSALSIKLKDGRLVADLQQLELYQGQGTGRLVLDGSGATPAMDARFELSGVQAEPLLRAAADNDQLSGTLETKLALKGTGRSQKDMVGTLAGSGNFKFADGTLKGVDLGAIAAKIEKVANTVQGGGANIMQSLGSGDMFGSFAALGAMFGGSGEVNQETKFTSLSGSYTVERGVATNRDLTMIGPLVNQRPLLRVQGDGTVNLPPRELAYRLDIRAFSQADQQRGVGGVVRLSGSMDSPDACVVVGSLCVGKETKPTDLISIEGIGKGVGGMLQKGPSLKAPGGAIGGLLGGKTGGVLGGVLGTGGAAPAPQPPAAAQPTAPAPQPKAPGGKLLDKLKGGFKLQGQ